MTKQEWLTIKQEIDQSGTIPQKYILQLIKVHSNLYGILKPKIPCTSCPSDRKKWNRIITEIDYKLNT